MTAARTHVRVVFDRLPELTGDLATKADEVVAKAAHDLEAAAKAGILGHGLVDTGAMLNSVQSRKLGPLRWVVEVGAHYGIYHEMGTRYLPARPFLYPAAESIRPAFAAAMAAMLRAA